MKYQKLTQFFIGSCALFLSATPAHAIMILEISSGSDSEIIIDGYGAGEVWGTYTSTLADIDGLNGGIGFWGSVGGFTSNIVMGTSKPLIGDENVAKLDLGSSRILGSGTITIRLTDTDYTLPVSPGIYQSSVEIGGATEGSVSFQTYLDNNNIAFGEGTTLADFDFGSGAFSGSNHLYDTATNNLFSLTHIMTITHTGEQQITSFNGYVAVPEPASLALLGLGLLGMGFVGMRRRRDNS